METYLNGSALLQKTHPKCALHTYEKNRTTQNRIQNAFSLIVSEKNAKSNIFAIFNDAEKILRFMISEVEKINVSS